jgi:hypothetical protein
MSDDAKPSTSAVRDVDSRVVTASAAAKANVALADYKMENDADDARAFESEDESDDASTISGASSLENDITRASTARSWHAAALVGASMARVDLVRSANANAKLCVSTRCLMKRAAMRDRLTDECTM